MIEYTTYQYRFYVEEQKNLQKALAEAKAKYAENPIQANEDALIDARRNLAVISERLVSARRHLRTKQALILSGKLGPMPEKFADGKTYRTCLNCHERRDLMDFLAIKHNKWVILDKCQVCSFTERSEMTIRAKDMVHEKTAEHSKQNVDYKMCLLCGETKSIRLYRRIGINKYGDVPYRYDYLCNECRSIINKHKFDPSNTGIQKPMPLLFNPQDPTKYKINPAYFISKEDLLDADKLTKARDIVDEINKLNLTVQDAIEYIIKGGY